MRLTEAVPFAGQALSVSGAVDVFGALPVNVTGTATTSGMPELTAEMTLNYDGGEPVNGLAIGAGLTTIGPRGLRYRITAFSGTMMEVERLTSSGAVDEDWPGFTYTETVGGHIKLDFSSLQGGYRGPFVAAPKSELITSFEYEVFYTAGLCGIGREGQIYKIAGIHTIEWRDSALAGAWVAQTFWNYGQSRDPQGFTHRINLPYPMRPEIRIKKEFVNQGGYSTEEYQDDAAWYGLRGLRQNSPTRYPGMTVITARIRGGDRLSAQSESQVNLEATRILPVRSGGAWQAPAPTRDIAPWCLYLLKSLGYTDADIDLAEFDRLHEIWRARGDYYDETIDDASTVKDMLNNALACGFAELVVSKGLIRPVRDEARAIFDREYGPKTWVYSPQNMTKALKITGPMPSQNDFDGVDIEYFSSVTWAWETVECRWPGDAGMKVEKIKLPGVSDKHRAWRIGMRRRGHQLYRTDTYSWETELDGRNSGYLSFCAVASDTPGLCQSALLESVEPAAGGLMLQSSEPLDWSAGGVHKIGIRRLDGTLSGPYQAVQVDDYHITVAELDFTPDTSWTLEPPHILFGPASKWAYPVLTTSSNPSNGNVAMKGMPYDARVYTYDDQYPPV